MAQPTQTIQVTIGNRSYPLSIADNEKESVLKAAEKINLQLKELEKNYGVKDLQDLLAMCCLQLSTDVVKGSKQLSEIKSEVSTDLLELDEMVTDYLSKV